MKRKTAADLGETAVFWGGFAIKQTVLYSIKKDVQRGDFKGESFPVRGITLWKTSSGIKKFRDVTAKNKNRQFCKQLIIPFLILILPSYIECTVFCKKSS